MADTDVDEIASESAPLFVRDEGFFSPVKRYYRFTGLFFICFITFGGEFSYVLPGALEKYFERDLGINTTQFTLFNSLYSWPSVVICIFGGILIDKVLGIRLGGIILSSFITLGNFLFAFGAYFNNVLVMDIGRFIFGMGGESVGIAQKAYVVEWFTSNELNMVFGFLIVGANSGATINQLVMVPVYKFLENYETGYKCLGLAIFVGAFACLFSTICTTITAVMDLKRTRYLTAKNIGTKKSTPPIEVKTFILMDVLSYPVELWIIILICVVVFSVTWPFMNLGKLYFMRKYDFSQDTAGYLQSVFFLITTIMSPVFGLIVDRTGYKTIWIILAALVALAAHSTMLFTFVNAFVPVITLALSLSIIATALWPMVSDLVPLNKLGSAYGLMQGIQNLGLAVTSGLSGYLVENYGYMALEMFFIVLCIIGLVASFFLYVIDKAKGGVLGKFAEQKQAETKTEVIVVN